MSPARGHCIVHTARLAHLMPIPGIYPARLVDYVPPMRPIFHASVAAAVVLASLAVDAEDRPQWGQAWDRNHVSAETGLPDSFDPETGKNIRWTAPLGSETYASPVVAHGRVFIGTNNEHPRDPENTGDRGVYLCLDEKTGELKWQLVVPKREEDIYHDWPKTGMSSPATVEGDRVYLVDNRGIVVCMDIDGLANGNQGPFVDEGRRMVPIDTNAPNAEITPRKLAPIDADILWEFNLTTKAGIWSHDGAHSSILIRGDHLYLNTGTGVDNTHKVIRTPDAPSLVVLDKKTGRMLARDRENIATNIFHCTWSSPALATVNGKELVIFAGGNGVLYAFDPLVGTPAEGEVAMLHKVWQFDCDPEAPKGDIHPYLGNRRIGPSNIFGMPVFADGAIFVAGGGDWWWGKNEAWLKRVDPRGTGDITAKNLVWSHPLGRHTMSTPTVIGGLVYAADSQHMLHCVDAKTGALVWDHDVGSDVWASVLAADGKLFLGTRRGDFLTFAQGREKKLLSSVKLDSAINATATAANGALYVATMKTLYAVGSKPN
jgi:outer membrane protein assembly factor BamB